MQKSTVCNIVPPFSYLLSECFPMCIPFKIIQYVLKCSFDSKITDKILSSKPDPISLLPLSPKPIAVTRHHCFVKSLTLSPLSHTHVHKQYMAFPFVCVFLFTQVLPRGIILVFHST